jgi:hypothetical protein
VYELSDHVAKVSASEVSSVSCVSVSRKERTNRRAVKDKYLDRMWNGMAYESGGT